MSDKDDRVFTPPEEPQAEGPEQGDFVFRFSAQPSTSEEAVYDDPLVELVRGQLADLLDAVVLTDHGRRVRVDGFRLLQDSSTQYEIFPPAEKPPKAEPTE